MKQHLKHKIDWFTKIFFLFVNLFIFQVGFAATFYFEQLGQTQNAIEESTFLNEADPMKSKNILWGLNEGIGVGTFFWEIDIEVAAHAYNNAWSNFFRTYPNATPQQIQNFGNNLMKLYGF